MKFRRVEAEVDVGILPQGHGAGIYPTTAVLVVVVEPSGKAFQVPFEQFKEQYEPVDAPALQVWDQWNAVEHTQQEAARRLYAPAADDGAGTFEEVIKKGLKYEMQDEYGNKHNMTVRATPEKKKKKGRRPKQEGGGSLPDDYDPPGG